MEKKIQIIEEINNKLTLIKKELSEFRESYKITLKEISEATDIDVKTLSRYLDYTHDSSIPTDKLFAICNFLYKRTGFYPVDINKYFVYTSFFHIENEIFAEPVFVYRMPFGYWDIDKEKIYVFPEEELKKIKVKKETIFNKFFDKNIYFIILKTRCDKIEDFKNADCIFIKSISPNINPETYYMIFINNRFCLVKINSIEDSKVNFTFFGQNREKKIIYSITKLIQLEQEKKFKLIGEITTIGKTINKDNSIFYKSTQELTI